MAQILLPWSNMPRRNPAYKVELPGGRLIYESWGSGPPVVLIHGLSGSTRWWSRNIDALTPHFTVYAIDLVGFGGNRGHRPLPLRRAAELLAAFITHVDKGPAHIIGHSMGGHISTYLAAEHPQVVDHLVLAAASGLVQQSLLGMALRLGRSSRYTSPDFAATLAWDALRAGSLNLLRAARELLSDDVTELLAKITAPTLVLSAEWDHLIPPELGARQHAAIKASQYVVLPQAGHVLMWDQAEVFNQLVLDFLNKGRSVELRLDAKQQAHNT